MRQIAIYAVVEQDEWQPRFIAQSYQPREKFRRRLRDGDFHRLKNPVLVILREVDDLDGPQALREGVARFRESLYCLPVSFRRPVFRESGPA